MSGPQVVFITGAASGVGRALALRLGARGARLALVDQAMDAAALTAFRDAAGPGVAAEGLRVDVTDAAALAAAVEAAVARFGPPDLAINSAGISFNRRFEDTTQAAFERMVAVNLFGSRNVAAALLPHLRPGARLALIASMAGLIGPYGYAAYAASKFGVVGLAEVLRMEQAPRGIGVSVICPPEIDTPMVRAEAREISPTARALKDMAGALNVDQACEAILRGLAARRFMIIPGRRARLLALAARQSQRLHFALADATVRRLERGGSSR